MFRWWYKQSDEFRTVLIWILALFFVGLLILLMV